MNSNEEFQNEDLLDQDQYVSKTINDQQQFFEDQLKSAQEDSKHIKLPIKINQENAEVRESSPENFEEYSDSNIKEPIMDEPQYNESYSPVQPSEGMNSESPNQNESSRHDNTNRKTIEELYIKANEEDKNSAIISQSNQSPDKESFDHHSDSNYLSTPTKSINKNNS